MADAHKPSLEEVDITAEKEATGTVHGVDANPAAAALAAVAEAEKPRMFSKGMRKLWVIVGDPYNRLVTNANHAT